MILGRWFFFLLLLDLFDCLVDGLDHGVAEEGDEDGHGGEDDRGDDAEDGFEHGVEPFVEVFGGALEGAGEFSGAFADADEVDEAGDEDAGAAHGVGELVTVADLFGDEGEFGSEVAVLDGLGGEFESFDEGDAVGHEVADSLKPLNVEAVLEDAAVEGEFELPAIPEVLVFLGLKPEFDGDDEDADEDEAVGPVVGDAVADGGGDFDAHGHFGVLHPVEEGGDFGNEVEDEDEGGEEAEEDEEGGVDESLGEAGAEFGLFFEVTGVEVENGVEAAAGFSGADEVAVERVELGGGFGEGLVEGETFGDPAAEAGGGLLKGAFVVVGFHGGEGGFEGEAGVEELGEFFGEGDEFDVFEFEGAFVGAVFGGFTKFGAVAFFRVSFGDGGDLEGAGFEVAESLGAGGGVELAGFFRTTAVDGDVGEGGQV